MYIEIFKKTDTTKGIKVNNLTYNSDDLIAILAHNVISLANKEDFINDLTNGKDPKIYHDITFQDYVIRAENNVLALKDLALNLVNNHGLTLDTDFKVMSDIVWNDNNLNLPVRVTIPESVVFNNPAYRALISHVEGLMAENKSHFYTKNGLVFLYFVTLLPEHEQLLINDNNVLIER
jgi:hypothetical protein